MLRLPKGSPLFEHLNTSTLQLDGICTKLAQGRFSGYANLQFSQAHGYLLYGSGSLISVLYESSQGIRLTGTEALYVLADQMRAATSGRLNVYRLSDDLINFLYALLKNDLRRDVQELLLVDIKGLLDRIRQEQLSCCLITYTYEQATLIAYAKGVPLGFFHDGSLQFALTADDSHRKITSSPLALLDFYILEPEAEMQFPNLLDEVDLAAIWHAASMRHGDAAQHT